jgi:hypothetical protein
MVEDKAFVSRRRVVCRLPRGRESGSFYTAFVDGE